MLRRAASLRSAREHYKVSKESRSSSRKLSKMADEPSSPQTTGDGRHVVSDSKLSPLKKDVLKSSNGSKEKKKKKKKAGSIKERKKSVKKNIEEAFPGVRVRTESRPPVEIEQMRKEWEKDKEEFERKSLRKKERRRKEQEKLWKGKSGTTIGNHIPRHKNQERETNKEADKEKKKKKRPDPVEAFPGIKVRTESRPPLVIEQLREEQRKDEERAWVNETKKKKKKKRVAKLDNGKDKEETKSDDTTSNSATTDDEPKKKKKHRKKRSRTSDVKIEITSPDNESKEGKERELESESGKSSEKKVSKKSKNKAKKDARRSLSAGGRQYAKEFGTPPAKLQLSQSASSPTTRSLSSRYRGTTTSPSSTSPKGSSISARSSSDADTRKISLRHSTGGTDVAMVDGEKNEDEFLTRHKKSVTNNDFLFFKSCFPLSHFALLMHLRFFHMCRGQEVR